MGRAVGELVNDEVPGDGLRPRDSCRRTGRAPERYRNTTDIIVRILLPEEMYCICIYPYYAGFLGCSSKRAFFTRQERSPGFSALELLSRQLPRRRLCVLQDKIVE